TEVLFLMPNHKDKCPAIRFFPGNVEPLFREIPMSVTSYKRIAQWRKRECGLFPDRRMLIRLSETVLLKDYPTWALYGLTTHTF
ncbi:hypothetical protein R856_08000, partial [Salmonella enterica subsp. arizonae]|nr:hypothetical protein [Salmonella enterica subsp. arizonae]